MFNTSNASTVYCPAVEAGATREACTLDHVRRRVACPDCIARLGPDATRALLKARTAAMRCAPRCRGWFVGEANHTPSTEIVACDECNSLANEAGAPEIDDSDAAALPEARRALARALVPDRRSRSRRTLAILRRAALREHELLTALYTVHLWAESKDPRKTRRIVDATSEALDLD